MERFWNELCNLWQLGAPLQKPSRVTGGYMHRMYRLEAPAGSYAVKLLNPEVMARPEAIGNYLCAAQLEERLEQARLPNVPALQLGVQQTLDTLDRLRFFASVRPDAARLFAAAFSTDEEM